MCCPPRHSPGCHVGARAQRNLRLRGETCAKIIACAPRQCRLIARSLPQAHGSGPGYIEDVVILRAQQTTNHWHRKVAPSGAVALQRTKRGVGDGGHVPHCACVRWNAIRELECLLLVHAQASDNADLPVWWLLRDGKHISPTLATIPVPVQPLRRRPHIRILHRLLWRASSSNQLVICEQPVIVPRPCNAATRRMSAVLSRAAAAVSCKPRHIAVGQLLSDSLAAIQRTRKKCTEHQRTTQNDTGLTYLTGVRARATRAPAPPLSLNRAVPSALGMSASFFSDCACSGFANTRLLARVSSPSDLGITASIAHADEGRRWVLEMD